MISSHMNIIHWLLKNWFHQNCHKIGENEACDEESSTHSPHQPQQVEGVQTGPLRHTGLASDYFHFLIDGVLCPLDQTHCGGKKHSVKFH